MQHEWFRDPEAVQMRRDIELVRQQSNQAAALISTHEKVCIERYNAIISGQRIVFVMLVILALLSFLGPHDGILAVLHAIRI